MAPECSVDGCSRDAKQQGAITLNVCPKHLIKRMSELRPDGEFAPVDQQS